MSPNEAGGDKMVERVVLFWLVWFLCLFCCIEPQALTLAMKVLYH